MDERKAQMLQVASVTGEGLPHASSSTTLSTRKIRKLDRAFRLFREIEETMPLTMAHALVTVGLGEGKSLQDLAQDAGVSISNFSRYLLALSDRARTGGPGSGLGLVIRKQDPMNLRKNNYYLSPKGKLFFSELMEIL